MLRRVTFALFCFALCAGAQAQGVRITWVGQACFYVQAADNPTTVVTDPPAASIGYPLPSLAADAVTISHNHTDHNNSAGVGGNFTLVDGRPVTSRQEISVASVPFVLIPGFHDNQNGAQRGQNTIVRWTQGGLRFAHFGDFGQDELTAAQLADLRGVDVIFVPAGGFFTIDAQRTATLITQLNPRVAVLMHFRTALGGPAQLAAFPAVVLPFAEIAYKPASVTLTAATLPASTEVWLMEPLGETVAVNAATFGGGVPVAPSSLVSLFGSFPGSVTAGASTFPLPRRLGETEVLVGGAPAPLLYVSPTQINFQVPRQPQVGQSVVEVRVGGQRVARGSVTVIPIAPGIFAAVNENGRLNSASSPARRGQVLQIFATGQGDVNPVVADGVAAPLQPLSVTPSLPDVFVGNRRALVQFSGLAPTLAGVWQINAFIPQDAPVGPAVPLFIIQGLRSNTLSVAIE